MICPIPFWLGKGQHILILGLKPVSPCDYALDIFLNIQVDEIELIRYLVIVCFGVLNAWLLKYI